MGVRRAPEPWPARRTVPHAIRPGDVLAGRYQLVDLLDESAGGLFYRAHDASLDRSVAVHIIRADDDRAALLREAARTSARVVDRRLLRVLDVDETTDQTARDGSALCYVVNEWATGISLDIMLADEGPLAPRRAAWIVGEVAATLEVAHAAGVSHGRLVPENVLIDRTGSVRVIGFAVDAALHGLPAGRVPTDVTGLAGLLYAALTARWPGQSGSVVKPAPHAHGRVLRPRQVRAGVPRVLDTLCDAVLNPDAGAPGSHARGAFDLTTAGGIGDALREFVGDPEDWPTPRPPPSADARPANRSANRSAADQQPADDDDARSSPPYRRPGSPAPADPEPVPTPGPGRPDPTHAARRRRAGHDRGAGSVRTARTDPRSPGAGPTVDRSADRGRHPDLRRRRRRGLVGQTRREAAAASAVRRHPRAAAVRARARRRQPGRRPRSRAGHQPGHAVGSPLGSHWAWLLAVGHQHRHRLADHDDRQRHHRAGRRVRRGRASARAAAGCGWPRWWPPWRWCCWPWWSPSTSAAGAPPSGRSPSPIESARPRRPRRPRPPRPG